MVAISRFISFRKRELSIVHPFHSQMQSLKANMPTPSIPKITVSSQEHGTRELEDWDCIDSLDLPLFESTLQHLHDHGTLPPDSVSKEDQNSVGESHVSAREIEDAKARVATWVEKLLATAEGEQQRGATDGPRRQIRIYIVDGFLLYPEPPLTSKAPSTTSGSTYPHSQDALTHLHALTAALLDPKLFIPSTRQQTLARRAARSGYVTLEGFWTDPPGYVEDVVWPNYVRYHAWMYKTNTSGATGEVEQFDDQACRNEGIQVCPGNGTWSMPEVLEWAVQRVEKAVEDKL